MTILSSRFALRMVCAALLTFAASACGNPVTAAPPAPPAPAPAPAAPSAPPPAGSAPIAALAQRIDQAIGAAACDNAGQCRTLAYGHKACGGPERYVAYSTRGTDTAALQAMAADLAAQRSRQDTEAGRMSTCSVVLDPGATCTAGRCVLSARGPGSNLAR